MGKLEERARRGEGKEKEGREVKGRKDKFEKEIRKIRKKDRN